jgi:hypothetical protein
MAWSPDASARSRYRCVETRALGRTFVEELAVPQVANVPIASEPTALGPPTDCTSASRAVE